MENTFICDGCRKEKSIEKLVEINTSNLAGICMCVDCIEETRGMAGYLKSKGFIEAIDKFGFSSSYTKRTESFINQFKTIQITTFKSDKRIKLVYFTETGQEDQNIYIYPTITTIEELELLCKLLGINL